MILFYMKLFNDNNKSLILENPQKGTWDIIIDKASRGSVPTLEDAILYRNSLYSNMCVNYLLGNFNVVVSNPLHYLTLTAYLTIDNYNDRFAKVLDSYEKAIKYCPILIYSNGFDKDNSEFLQIKQKFLDYYGVEAENNIICYENLINDMSYQNKLTELINKYNII